MKRGDKVWSWFIMILGILYFFLPLLATFIFSLKAKLGVLSFQAYANIFNDPQFIYNFSSSVLWAVLTIIVGILLFVPTAFCDPLEGAEGSQPRSSSSPCSPSWFPQLYLSLAWCAPTASLRS